MSQAPILNLVRNLCKELCEQNVAYCHWKSNAMLDRSASGQNDLDLLIEQEDAQRFEKIIQEMGFMEANTHHHEQLPGITHYYALDSSSGRFVHLHRHYQLILGHDLTKNYHLPLETPFIHSAIQQGLFRVPAPELELIVFVIRMVLKRPILDRYKKRDLGPFSSAELAYLQSRASKEELCSILQTHLPQVSAEMWQESLRSLQPSHPWWDRVKAGWKLRQALRDYRRRPWVLATTLKLWRRYRNAICVRLTGKLPRKSLSHGGSIVAIVGGDGAGKSTVVHGLSEWLAQNFEVLQAHMGKPPKMWSTSAVELLLKVAGYVRKLLRKDGNTPQLSESHRTTWLECLMMLRPVCIARDRLRLYEKMKRFALHGGLVICDRYHLPCIKLMDGPQLSHLLECGQTSHAPSRVARFLAQTEERYYNQIAAPDVLLVLQVAPDTAIQRKPEEDADSVRRRSREIWDLDWRQIPAQVIDASRSATEVLSVIKTTLWQSLIAVSFLRGEQANFKKQPR